MFQNENERDAGVIIVLMFIGMICMVGIVLPLLANADIPWTAVTRHHVAHHHHHHIGPAKR